MRIVLFCYHPYSFGILKPLFDAASDGDNSILWYVRKGIESEFLYRDSVEWTSSIQDIYDYSPDAIFVPGNEVPHYLRGVKVQVFHGLAGEKKGHFRIRDYFDLYLTQGPYFTNRFKELAARYGNFEVMETGWSKLDTLFLAQDRLKEEKEMLLAKYGAGKIVLYAPTFSPSLTSANDLIDSIEELASNKDYLVIIKFHDLMDKGLAKKYMNRLGNHERVLFAEDHNIIKYLVVSDLMISDTSSVVYEFILLDKPVITYKSSSTNIEWKDISDAGKLYNEVLNAFQNDEHASDREKIINSYHPYSDWKSSLRMIKAVEDYINRNGVPERRKLGLLRRRKIRRMFGSAH